MDFSLIKEAILSDKFIVTLHAEKEKREDKLLLSDIKKTILEGTIIEDYPTNKPFPSCLILGFCGRENPIHSVVAYDQVKQKAILVTVYRPDPKKWVEYKKRR